MLVLWSGLDEWRAEVAEVALTGDGLGARGTQLGVGPAYRLDYRLEAAGGFVTRRLDVTVTSEGWTRALALTRAADGAWACARADGGAALAGTAAEAPRPDLDGALDCDLGRSPLTNLMPVRRHGLLRPDGAAEILAAWVDVPELTVHASRQRYEHVRAAGGGAVVRYTDLGAHEGFTADLLLDADGLVVEYPGLARRVTAPA